MESRYISSTEHLSLHLPAQLTVGEKAKARCPDQGTCKECGYISSQEVVELGITEQSILSSHFE